MLQPQEFTCNMSHNMILSFRVPPKASSTKSLCYSLSLKVMRESMWKASNLVAPIQSLQVSHCQDLCLLLLDSRRYIWIDHKYLSLWALITPSICCLHGRKLFIKLYASCMWVCYGSIGWDLILYRKKRTTIGSHGLWIRTSPDTILESERIEKM